MQSMTARPLFLQRRRTLLLSSAAALACPSLLAQPGRGAGGRPLVVAQVVDMSPAQQDISRDFLVGSRTAWQDLQSRGGLRRPVQHVTLETDGTPASVRAAVASVRDDPACVAISGTAGDPAATQVAAVLREENLAIAHAAPWLQNSSVEVDDRTFPIFAARQEQIGHALRSLTSMGVQDVGVVYASATEQRLYGADLQRIATELKARLHSYTGDGELSRLGQRLTPGTPALLLFVGGTPELVQFTQGLERQQRQRYLIALADVNLQTMMQMAGGRIATPVIATQAVPMVTAALPVVRQYREALARLFDEPPSPLSLAGFIAARYTAQVLGELDGAPSRAAVLAAFQRRSAVDVGGFRVQFDPQRRSSGFVTQSMLTQDGRVVG